MAQNLEHEREQALLGILQGYAPTSKEQAKCTEFFNNMKKENNSHAYICLSLISAMYDGLSYGDWLWK